MTELYKYIDEHNIERSRNPIFENGVAYSNPTEATLKILGYKELVVVETMPVQEGFYAMPVYTDGNTITQTWELVKDEVQE